MGIQFSGLASGIDTDSIITELMSAERLKVEKVEKELVLSEWKEEVWEDMNSKLYSFYKGSLFDFKSQGTYSQKSVTSSNTSLISASATIGATRGSHTIDVTTMAKGSFLTGSELVDVTLGSTAEDLFGLTGSDTGTLNISLDGGLTTSEITIEATDNMAEVIEKIEKLDLDLNISFDTNFNRLFISSTETGENIEIQLTGDENILTGLGFATDNRTGTIGTDAVFDYNGTTLTSSSNEVVVNGLSFDILSEGDSATITVTQDTEAIYDAVKGFLEKYNELMMDMTEKIDADAVTDYEPLTADEKESMTDSEIELWETTIKESLLRRDDILTSVSYSLRNTLTSSSGVDTTGFTFKSLSALGIVTGGYEEKGLLHIEGDEDDSIYQDKTNKLMAAIKDDPDAVMELLTALGTAVYENMSEKMKSNTLSSALTFYNDKYITKEISDYEDDILDLEDRLAIVEERYRKQFTAMELAIQKANSTSEWLTQQLSSM